MLAGKQASAEDCISSIERHLTRCKIQLAATANDNGVSAASSYYCSARKQCDNLISSTNSNPLFPGDWRLQHALADVDTSLMSFNSSIDMDSSYMHGESAAPNASQQKIEAIYSLLTLIRTSSTDHLQLARELLTMSQQADSRAIMWQHNCIPILVQLMHHENYSHVQHSPTQHDIEILKHAAEALLNMVAHQADESKRAREIQILKYLNRLRVHTINLRLALAGNRELGSSLMLQDVLVPAIANLMKHSFDQHCRQATTFLGGLPTFAELLIAEQALYGDEPSENNIKIRHYAGMTLTNLTYQDASAKKTLCMFDGLLAVFNAQIRSPHEELKQVFASVLRNLSWKADAEAKSALREASCVSTLMYAAQVSTKEATIRALLSALWNLSAHYNQNKQEICSIPGALTFLVTMLNYNSPTRRVEVIENAGGILRTVSSVIAQNDSYRQILRDHNCSPILLKQLRSSSLTIVSNACGTLWNLSARNQQDQALLWQLGAVPMLRRLVNSRHRLIAVGSAAALKNLLNNRPEEIEMHLAKSNDGGPLLARRVRALERDLNEQYLADLCLHNDAANLKLLSSSQSDRGVAPVNMAQRLLCDMTPVANPVQLARGVTAQRRTNLQKKKSASKEEQMNMDRQATQRYQNSLRRQQRLSGIRSRTAASEPDMSQHYELATPNAQYNETNGECDDLDVVRSYDQDMDEQASTFKVPSKFKPLATSSAAPLPSELASSPMMFSRQSSCSSLNSDLASQQQPLLDSELASAYTTQVHTGLLSPSDLPDSPCGSPTRVNDTQEEMIGDDSSEKETKIQNIISRGSQDEVRVYHDEDRSSTALSNLSAMTIDSQTRRALIPNNQANILAPNSRRLLIDDNGQRVDDEVEDAKNSSNDSADVNALIQAGMPKKRTFTDLPTKHRGKNVAAVKPFAFDPIEGTSDIASDGVSINELIARGMPTALKGSPPIPFAPNNTENSLNTTLTTIQPETMKISLVCGNEKIRDATTSLPSAVTSQRSPASRSKDSDDTGGSLLEDNFEPLDDTQPSHEDSDINLQAQANQWQFEIEAGAEELLIECESLSLVSSARDSIASDATYDAAPSVGSRSRMLNRPTIPNSTSCEQAGNRPLVKPSFPRNVALPVRTTRTAQLRKQATTSAYARQVKNTNGKTTPSKGNAPLQAKTGIEDRQKSGEGKAKKSTSKNLFVV